MRRRRVVRLAGMEFTIALLDHMQSAKSRFRHPSESFAGRTATIRTMEDGRLARKKLGSGHGGVKQIQKAKLLLRGQE